MSYSKVRQLTTKMASEALWTAPCSFGVARIFGRSYGLRSVVFHNIAFAETPFTKGMRVSVTPRKFEAALKFLTAHYTPVDLQDVLAERDGSRLPDRAVLVTFDDAYASVAELAAPLCREYRVPAVFFVNAAFVDNRQLAPDSLVCYVANVLGMDAIRSAARTIRESEASGLQSLSDVFGRLFPAVSLEERELFLGELQRLANIDGAQVARKASLYVTAKELRNLARSNFEIGNHTRTHVHCRSLSPDQMHSEVAENKAELESITGTKVRSFSQPYGSSKDISRDLVEHLKSTGHEVAFLSESVANPRSVHTFCRDRISVRAESDDALFFEIEVLPRLRGVRNLVRPADRTDTHKSQEQTGTKAISLS